MPAGGVWQNSEMQSNPAAAVLTEHGLGSDAARSIPARLNERNRENRTTDTP